MGSGSSSTGTSSVAIGWLTSATADHAVAIAANSACSQTYQTKIGNVYGGRYVTTTTADATPTAVTIYNVGATINVNFAGNIYVTAMDLADDVTTKMFRIADVAVMRCSGSISLFSGAPATLGTSTGALGGVAGWTVSIAMSGNNLQMTFTGEAARTINWYVTLQTTVV